MIIIKMSPGLNWLSFYLRIGEALLMRIPTTGFSEKMKKISLFGWKKRKKTPAYLELYIDI